MTARQSTHEVTCKGCRGHGWKLRRSRRALVIGTLTRGGVDGARQSCLECGGSGKSAGQV